jgi:hypothetical protein
MAVAGTEPLVWVRIRLPAYPEPEEVESSKPVGAVTVMLPLKLEPEAEKLWGVEGEPKLAVIAVSVPVTAIAGMVPAVTVLGAVGT